MKRETFFIRLGEKGIDFFTTVYEISLLFVQTVKRIPKLWFYRRQFLEQPY